MRIKNIILTTSCVVMCGIYPSIALAKNGNFSPDNLKKSEQTNHAMSYLSNLYMANNMFNLEFKNHVGERGNVTGITGQKHSTTLWAYGQAGFSEFSAEKGQLKTHSNWESIQFGGDVVQWGNIGDYRGTFHLGLTTGKAFSKNKSEKGRAFYDDNSKVEGSSYGFYASWADNEEMHRGLYISASLLWNDLNANVNDNDEYKLRGIVSSIDTGYAFILGQVGDYAFLFEPQAQITYQGVKPDNPANNESIEVNSNYGNIRSRLGFRTALQNDYDEHALGAQIFAEASWIHNTRNYYVSFDDGSELTQDSIKNIGEVKVGAEGYIVRNLFVWFNLAGQKGQSDYKNVAMALGMQYYFK